MLGAIGRLGIERINFLTDDPWNPAHHAPWFMKALPEYDEVFTGSEAWRTLPVPEGDLYAWDRDSTYVKHPPYFEGMTREVPPLEDIRGARVLALLGDSITTDHISPAGSIKANGPAGKYLIERGVAVADFNSYGSRRGNDEVMVRGTFANVRLRNLLAPGTEGGVTRYLGSPTNHPVAPVHGGDSGGVMSIYDASLHYKQAHTPAFTAFYLYTSWRCEPSTAPCPRALRRYCSTL